MVSVSLILSSLALAASAVTGAAVPSIGTELGASQVGTVPAKPEPIFVVQPNAKWEFYKTFTCDKRYLNSEELKQHLIISQSSVRLASKEERLFWGKKKLGNNERLLVYYFSDHILVMFRETIPVSLSFPSPQLQRTYTLSYVFHTNTKGEFPCAQTA